MASRPGRGPARRDGVATQLAPERTRERGAAALHVAEEPDLGHERLLASYDATMDYALGGVEAAFVDARGDWAERMRAAVAHLLELAAEHPCQARMCTIEIFEAGQAGVERRDRSMLRFMRLCEAGYSQSGLPLPTNLMPQVIAGAVFELIRSHASDDRLEQLPDALPTALLIVLSPILGRDDALRVAEAA